jgi:nucleoside-diphosphate-sugar epimerase
MPLRRVLELMAEISGRRVRRIQVNGRVAEMVTATLEFIADHVTRRPPSGTAEGVRIALRAGALSIEKAQRELGYAPGPVEPVLRETIAQLLDAGHSQSECDPTSDTPPFHIERRIGG